MLSDCDCKLLIVFLQLHTGTSALCKVRPSCNPISRTGRFEQRGKSKKWWELTV